MRRSALVALPTLLALVAAAPAADAASRLVIKGRGYGHGIGLSQYGAYGYATHGFTYRQIIERYYQGTAIQQLDPRPDVRVLLQSGRRIVVSGARRTGSRKLSPTRRYQVVMSRGKLVLKSASGKRLKSVTTRLRFRAATDGALTLHGTASNGLRDGRYRGVLDIVPGNGNLLAVNALGLEDYLRGVISAESPANWPAEALRAQAVVARSYAITTNAGGANGAFTQYADVRSQMYRGVAAEFPSTDAAVKDTAGQIVAYNGQPVATFFFSTSGGHTENVENSFIGSLPRPWLRGVDDPFDDASPKHTWGPITLTAAQAAKKLRGLVRGEFRGVNVVQRGVSPRIVRAEVVGSAGVTAVTGPQLRARFGLNDTWATFTFLTSDAEKPEDAPAPDPAADGSGGVAASATALPVGAVRGRIDRARAGDTVRLQQRTHDGRWRTVAHTTVRAGGRYHVRPGTRGTFRAVWKDVAGPAVRVR